jgi:outer membrane protein assembly factor BamB
MKHLGFCLFVLLSVESYAQWSARLQRPVSWYEIAPTGNLVLGTDKGIMGLNEADGSVLYEMNNIEFPTEQEFEVIPNTPYGMITRGQGKLESKVIFNLYDGKVLFDSKKENIIIGKQFVLGSTGDLLMQGLRDMQSSFFLVDITKGAIRWELKDPFGKSIFAEVIDGPPVETPDGNLIIATAGGMSGGGIYCFSPIDGKQIWKAALPKAKGPQTTTVTQTKLVVTYTEKNKFIYVKGQLVMAYDMSSGSPLWPEAAKQRGLPDQIIYDPMGLIVSSAVDPNNNLFKPTMAMYDYKTGKDLWPEQVKLRGTVTHYVYSDKGLIIGMDGGNGSTLINIVDLENGTYLFEKFYKVNGAVREMALLNGSVYVRTDLEEDIVSLESGTSTLGKNISSKAEMPLVNMRHNQLSYTFNPADGMLYVTDLGKGYQQPLVKSKIEFEQKETPGKIELLEGNIVLSSSQTVAAYSPEGAELFKTHIPAPGISGWKKALYVTSAILNTMDAMRYAELEAKAKNAALNTSSKEGRELLNAIGQLANNGASVRLAAASREMEMIRKRFKASAAGQDIQFILGRLENKDYGIFGISKISGQKKTEISFGKDKEPKYLLDDVSRVVYYLNGGVDMKAIRY